MWNSRRLEFQLWLAYASNYEGSFLDPTFVMGYLFPDVQMLATQPNLTITKLKRMTQSKSRRASLTLLLINMFG